MVLFVSGRYCVVRVLGYSLCLHLDMLMSIVKFILPVPATICQCLKLTLLTFTKVFQ
jgi:hypothetical protein